MRIRIPGLLILSHGVFRSDFRSAEQIAVKRGHLRTHFTSNSVPFCHCLEVSVGTTVGAFEDPLARTLAPCGTGSGAGRGGGRQGAGTRLGTAVEGQGDGRGGIGWVGGSGQENECGDCPDRGSGFSNRINQVRFSANLDRVQNV